MSGPSGLVILRWPKTWADAVLGPGYQNCWAVGPKSHLFRKTEPEPIVTIVGIV